MLSTKSQIEYQGSFVSKSNVYSGPVLKTDEKTLFLLIHEKSAPAHRRLDRNELAGFFEKFSVFDNVKLPQGNPGSQMVF